MKTVEKQTSSLNDIFLKAEGFAKLYGKNLYEWLEDIGVVTAEDYKLNLEEGNIELQDHTGVKLFIQIKSSVMDKLIDENKVFTIGKFVATRDEAGEYNGESWSVAKGVIKLFAY